MAPRLTRLAMSLVPHRPAAQRLTRTALTQVLAEGETPFVASAIRRLQRLGAAEPTRAHAHEPLTVDPVGRIVLVLVDLDGYTHEGAAQLLGLPTEVVTAHHRSARARLGVTAPDSTCRGWLLVTRLQQLTEPEREAVHRHLALCRPCRIAEDARSEVRRRLAAALPLLASGGALAGLFGSLPTGSVLAAALVIGGGAVLGALGLWDHVGAGAPEARSASRLPAVADYDDEGPEPPGRPRPLPSVPAAVPAIPGPSPSATPMPTPAAPRPTSVPIGPVVALRGLELGDGHLQVGADGLVPGDVLNRPVTLVNRGDASFATITIRSSARRSSLLDTDPGGLQLSVQRCSLPWQTTTPHTYTCPGRESEVLGPQPVIVSDARLPASPARRPSGTDQLLVTLQLPADAPLALQGQTSVIGITFTGAEE